MRIVGLATQMHSKMTHSLWKFVAWSCREKDCVLFWIGFKFFWLAELDRLVRDAREFNLNFSSFDWLIFKRNTFLSWSSLYSFVRKRQWHEPIEIILDLREFCAVNSSSESLSEKWHPFGIAWIWQRAHDVIIECAINNDTLFFGCG